MFKDNNRSVEVGLTTMARSTVHQEGGANPLNHFISPWDIQNETPVKHILILTA